MSRSARQTLAAVAVVLAAIGVGAVAPTPAGADSAPFCGITWGSGIKRSGPPNSPGSPLTDVRVGQHDCFDRMVFDLGGETGGYRVHYVDDVHQVATGNVIPLRAGTGAKLEIVLKLPADDGNGNQTYDGVSPRRLPRVDLTGFRTFRVAKFGGSFEGRTIIALGVRARLPMRVTTADNRIIVDVAHEWEA